MSYTSQRNQLPTYLVNKDKKKWKRIGDFQVKELMDNRSPAPLVLFIFLVSADVSQAKRSVARCECEKPVVCEAQELPFLQTLRLT